MLQEVPSKLRWACRRGMLELDVLLGNFLEKFFLTLSAADQEVFVQLLACGDQDLFMWLMGRSLPENPNFAKMVGIIRENARKSH